MRLPKKKSEKKEKQGRKEKKGKPFDERMDRPNASRCQGGGGGKTEAVRPKFKKP